MPSDAIAADGSQLTNRLLAKLYVAQHRHLHGAIVDLVQIGVPLAEVAVVVGMAAEEVQRILDEAAELASRAIGRPPAAERPSPPGGTR
jgi:hypothetical protein